MTPGTAQSPRDGVVRAVLVDHVLSRRPDAKLHRHMDPNALLAADQFAAALDAVRNADGEAALRSLGHEYVALWARTFRGLVRHLRGRPERSLELFCAEVYPFLRGDRRAARIESMGRSKASVLLADDLPPAYLAGILEAFIGLSGAETHARVAGRERFDVTYHLHPRDATARTIQWVAGLRIPLLITAALGILLGAAAALAIRHQVAWLPALAVLLGGVAAQSGANAVHDLRRRDMGPLDRPRTGRNWKWFQAGGSYAVAATALATLLWLGHVWILGLAGVSLALGIGYAALRNHGLGPFLAVVAHGPLVVAASFLVLLDAAPGTATFDIVLLGAGPGLLTAAMLYLDDIADRPLDEAGGKRTLAVRFPQRRNMVAYAGLLLTGVLAAAMVVARWLRPVDALWLLPSLGIAVALIREVKHHLDDPRALARSRFVTLALHIITTALVATLLLTELP